MASITIRNLEESVKQALRERAARNGRSMEEEARLYLASLDREIPASTLNPSGIASPVQVSSNLKTTSLDPPKTVDPYYPATGKKVLLIMGGGIAAYKCLDLIRRLRERGVSVRAVMTRAAQEFVTPLSVGALTADRVFSDLFDRADEHDVGHIRLSREVDLVIVAPATADLMAKMANGHADDLASTTLLATNKPVLVAPAMNPAMWHHKATQRNVRALKEDGIHFIGPNKGEMAEADEAGYGRMSEPMEIVEKVGRLLDNNPKPLRGKRIIMTSGPTHEPIDPVRYIANRSSGKQGHAIAEAAARAGAEVILVSGPVTIPDPRDVHVIKVESAREMQKAVEAALPADIAIMVAAVADWRSADEAGEKMKKENGKGPSSLKLTENPDILKGVGHHKNRPSLVIGFAAETEDLEKHAKGKLERKRADWIVANDVSPETGVMGGDRNAVKLVSRDGIDVWPEMSKQEVADRLVEKIVEAVQVETVET